MIRRRVLILSTNADLAGAPLHVLALLKGAPPDIDYTCVFGEEGPVADSARALGLHVHIVPEMRSQLNPALDLKALKRLHDIARQVQPAIIHSHSTKAGMLGRLTAQRLGVPSVFTVHGWGWEGGGPVRKLATWTVEAGLSKLCRNARYIFVSQATAEQGRRALNLREDQGMVIWNGVEDRPLTPAPTASRDAPVRILMVARVAPQKDHETLVRAFARLGPGWELWLCGTGTDAPEFKANCADWLAQSSAALRDTHFLGARSDIPDLLARTDIFALTSVYEALPISIIEAMRAGRAIVASDVGGVSELIQSGQTGQLVSPGDVEAVATALQNLREQEERARLGQAARARFVEHFHVDQMISKVADLYTSLAPLRPLPKTKTGATAQ